MKMGELLSYCRRIPYAYGPGVIPHSECDERYRALEMFGSYRDARRGNFYDVMQFSEQHQLAVNLCEKFVGLSHIPVLLPTTKDILDWLSDQPIVSWLNENCPNHRRCGPLVGFNDENEMFAFRMRWS
jgi:hypothetical protein